jgi:hypothetical protein
MKAAIMKLTLRRLKVGIASLLLLHLEAHDILNSIRE